MQEMLWFNGFTPTRQSRISEVLSQFVWGLRSVAELKRLQNMIKQGTYKSNTFNKRKQQQEQTFVWDLWAWKFKRIWISEVKSSFTLALIYFRYAWRRAFFVCLYYRRAILLPLWAHNGSTSNTLKSMGETKSGCNNIQYCIAFSSTLDEQV